MHLKIIKCKKHIGKQNSSVLVIESTVETKVISPGSPITNKLQAK